jgi:transposase
MPRTRHVRPLTEAEKAELQAIYKASPDFSHRQRAHAILLSDRGHSVGQVAEIFGVDRDTAGLWISRFENRGAFALKNLPRSGRRRIYTDEDARQLKALVDGEPRRIKRAAGLLQERTGKTACLQTLRRLLKKTPVLVAPLPPLDQNPAGRPAL